ncbi:MAG: hypothetical protein ACXAB4_08955 [Candidatus Hodarchaeales archaeon]
MDIYEKYARQIVQLTGTEWDEATEERQQGLFDLLLRFHDEFRCVCSETKEPDKIPALREEIDRIQLRLTRP